MTTLPVEMKHSEFCMRIRESWRSFLGSLYTSFPRGIGSSGDLGFPLESHDDMDQPPTPRGLENQIELILQKATKLGIPGDYIHSLILQSLTQTLAKTLEHQKLEIRLSLEAQDTDVPLLPSGRKWTVRSCILSSSNSPVRTPKE